jgi:hypothetical protein
VTPVDLPSLPLLHPKYTIYLGLADLMSRLITFFKGSTFSLSITKASQYNKRHKTAAKTFRRFLVEKKMKRLKIKLFSTAQAYQFTDYLSKDLALKNRNFNKQRGFLVPFFEFFRKRKVIPVNPIIELKLARRRSRAASIFPFVQSRSRR